MSIQLTTLEIKHLAESAGLEVDDSNLDEHEMESEHTIMQCPDKGVENDNGVIEYFNYVTTCDGCDSNEATPLGNPIINDDGTTIEKIVDNDHRGVA